MAPLVQVSGLKVVASRDGLSSTIVEGVGFALERGEVMALVGESGSGKTTIALSLLGYARDGCRIAGGTVSVGGVDVLALDRAGLARLRGSQVAYVPQSAAASFNPSRTIMDQVIEPALIHHAMPAGDARQRAVGLFRALALPDPETLGHRYPHQVSGGQLQRLMAAMALITRPELIVFDEPTTALDVTTQIEVLRAFKAAIRQFSISAVYVSHDLAVVAQVADRVIVLKDGTVRETGRTGTILTAPEDDYTRSLLAAAEPAKRHAEAPASPGPAAPVPLLEVRGLVAGYGTLQADGLPRATILHDVGFAIAPAATLGVIGESGCGKSTLARVVAGLLPAARGDILLDGRPLPRRVADRTREQQRQVQIVFQMADTALNPAHDVARLLGRPLRFFHGMAGERQRRRVDELLDLVRLPRALAGRTAGELSGGQKQRVNLARALAAEPRLILCDEVTSALDTVVAAAVLDLLADLKRDLGLSLMFISHDLSTVRSICDDVMILYAGQRMEMGRRGALAQRPLHPYSDLLISSVPELRTGWLDGLARRRDDRPDETPRAARRGCSFYPRCPVREIEVCNVVAPPVRALAKGADILCHRTERELSEAQGLQPAA